MRDNHWCPACGVDHECASNLAGSWVPGWPICIVTCEATDATWNVRDAYAAERYMADLTRCIADERERVQRHRRELAISRRNVRRLARELGR